MTYDPTNHYWIIGGSATEVYSSKSNTMVPVADAAYQAWLVETEQGSSRRVNVPAKASDVEALRSVIMSLGILPEWLVVAKPTFIQPAPGTYTKEQLCEYSADRRWREEISGIQVNGKDVRTARPDQGLTDVARSYAVDTPAATDIHYKIADGSFITLTSAEMVDVAVQIGTHVQTCFNTEKDVRDKITAGTVTTLEQIDAEYDPLVQRIGRVPFAQLRRT